MTFQARATSFAARKLNSADKRPPRKPKTLVYFIARGETGPIKIGFTSTNPFDRMAKLQTSTHDRLVLIGVIRGDKKFEHSLHRIFSPYRVGGEWFERNEIILQFIKRSSELRENIYLMSRERGESESQWRGSKGGTAKGVSAWRERNDIAPEWLVRNMVAEIGAKRTAALLENKISASTLDRKYRLRPAA